MNYVCLQRQVGIDKQGRPVVYSSFVQATGSFTAEDNVQHTLYLMENAKRCMRPEEYTWVWVLDCSGKFLNVIVIIIYSAKISTNNTRYDITATI